jgi:lysophospholipase
MQSNNSLYTNSYVLNSRGTQIYFQEWTCLDPKALVLLIHGVGEHSGRYSEFAQALNKAGISVYAFDLEGFGRSEGRSGHIDQFSYYSQDVKLIIDRITRDSKIKKPLFLLGHSLGALISLQTLYIYDNCNLAGLILCGPPFKLNLSAAAWYHKVTQVLSSILPVLTIQEKSIEINMLTHDETKKAEFLRDPYRHYRRTFKFMREFFKTQKMASLFCDALSVPVLIVQGGEDTVIDIRKVQEFYSAISVEDKTLVIYPGMYHEVLNELDRVRVYSDLIKWISDRSNSED